MNSAAISAGSAAAPRLLGLRIQIIIVAVIETFDGLSSAPALPGDMSES
jgi:hypothetical protein